ncbi:hypothetical protein QQF64_014100 [Cirrhinus molitorella]|uniref:Uncharacterized protein n=1 Tax=Cirrhinus molitorella TaxID=172907 RepID=A0ABR3LT30_9TELE
MVEEALTTPGGRPTAAERVVVEPEAESRRSGTTPRIRRAKAEQMAPATEAEAEIRRAAAEPERSRTEAELEGRRSPAEPEGRSDEAQPDEWSPEAMAG